MSIRHWPHPERPREKLLERGAHALSDAELLALLLGSGTRGRTAVELGRMLIAELGSVRDLLNSEAQRRRGHLRPQSPVMLRCGCHQGVWCHPIRPGVAPMSTSEQLPLPLEEPPEGDAVAGFANPTAEPQRLWVRGTFDELRTATATEIIAAARRAMTRRVRR